MTEHQRLAYLLNKYLQRNCSAQELQEFYALVNDPANGDQFENILDEAILKINPEYQIDEDKKSAMLEQIFAHHNVLTIKEPVILKKQGYLKMWAAAAAVILVAGAALYFYTNSSYGSHDERTNSINDIASLGNKATLTLSNGKKIVLSDAKAGVVIDASKLTYSDGSIIEDVTIGGVESPKFATITTPRGGQYQVVLPDGTKVWLNAASSIKFPSTFVALNERRIELSGEAYFEVFKDKSRPFRVISSSAIGNPGKNQVIEVLGTHFNINSYDDEESIRTTLLEGSVKVMPLAEKVFGKDVFLRPGQQAVLNDSKFRVVEADVASCVAWKDGYLHFSHADIKTVMRQLARWYDIDVRYEGNLPKLEFEGDISKDMSLAQVFKILNKSEVNFKIRGKEVTVMP